MNKAAHAQLGGGREGGRQFYMHQQHGICILAVLFSVVFKSFSLIGPVLKKLKTMSAVHVRTGHC